MSQKLSRREFASRALAAGAGAVLAGKAIAQDSKLEKKQKVEPPDQDVSALEAKLEKPLPDRLRGPAKAALKNIRNAAKERQRFRLPEGSEPCTAFAAMPPRSQS